MASCALTISITASLHWYTVYVDKSTQQTDRQYKMQQHLIWVSNRTITDMQPSNRSAQHIKWHNSTQPVLWHHQTVLWRQQTVLWCQQKMLWRQQTDLALLTDDWHLIFQFDIIEQRLQEYVGNSNQTVIFLRLIERIVSAGRGIILPITHAPPRTGVAAANFKTSS